ncbi:3,4-dihydroxy-2-butanone-4-phosphate synthase [Allomyces macrogynus ATCC 38327]|uniref:3,4-dihydroxy-2-butanone 4-phosphate synthase n=1 Tax=Allomyces macrogynus (strain ATCC 38327) TaxID=578462 RepID=A0A0L0SJY5_ALLM3|nr:3,4-dihydroxy-2-butanone-4-phosphate synthase [Allomyces macrogynus ATCC 38327]|eukprot:KNE62786.1 3,4-dihydroxy-2-butanone-4-phosphate synthase [Allomyces macrogynus ATCC 38327]
MTTMINGHSSTPSTQAHGNGTAAAQNGHADHVFDSIADAIADFAAGKFVVVVDDEGRENEGDLIIAAEKVTEAKMAFMVRHTSGLVCAPMLPSRCDALGLPLMVPPEEHTESHGTKYTISVDAEAKTTTGISAHDRALTCNLLADPTSTPGHFVRPGHLLPLRYQPGGVLARRGHTEAGVDLCRLAGLQPAAVICEVVLDNGKMARRDDLRVFSREHGLKLITVEALAQYIRGKLAKEGGDWTIA